MFTPDGRLLQVEYAEKSSVVYSSPLVAVLVPPSYSQSGSQTDPGGIVMACLSPPYAVEPKEDASKEEDDTEDDDDVSSAENAVGFGGSATVKKRDEKCSNLNRQPIRQQKRFVELSLDHPKLLTENEIFAEGNIKEGSLQFTRPSSSRSIMVGLSGFLSDNLALLRHAQSQVNSWHRSYGDDGSNSLPFLLSDDDDAVVGFVNTGMGEAVQRVAQSIGDACQSHSFGGGLRPYGACLMLCAVDQVCCVCGSESTTVMEEDEHTTDQGASSASSCNKKESESPMVATRYTLCTTFPSGMVKRYSYVLHKEQSQAVDCYGSCVVLGGTLRQQSLVQEAVREKMSMIYHASIEEGADDNFSRNPWTSTIQACVQALLEDHRKRNPQSDIFHSKRQDDEAGQGVSKNKKQNFESDKALLSSLPQLEMVLQSPRWGVRRVPSHTSFKYIFSGLNQMSGQ